MLQNVEMGMQSYLEMRYLAFLEVQWSEVRIYLQRHWCEVY